MQIYRTAERGSCQGREEDGKGLWILQMLFIIINMGIRAAIMAPGFNQQYPSYTVSIIPIPALSVLLDGKEPQSMKNWSVCLLTLPWQDP